MIKLQNMFGQTGPGGWDSYSTAAGSPFTRGMDGGITGLSEGAQQALANGAKGASEALGGNPGAFAGRSAFMGQSAPPPGAGLLPPWMSYPGAQGSPSTQQIGNAPGPIPAQGANPAVAGAFGPPQASATPRPAINNRSSSGWITNPFKIS